MLNTALLLVLLLLVVSVVAYFGLRSQRPKVFFSIAFSIFMLFGAGIFLALPYHLSKLQILEYTKGKYDFRYFDIQIIKPFSYLSLIGLDEVGAVAFASSASIMIPQGDDSPLDCSSHIYELGARLPPRLVPSKEELTKWACITESYNGNRYHHFTLLQDTSKGNYFLTFAWSFG